MVIANALPRRLTQTVVAASTLAILSSGAAACHPRGVVQKDVQNLTTKSAFATADSAGTAITAHPGDTLVYRIAITNQASGNQDQMINTIITDQLPAGLQLMKADNFNVGTVGTKQTATRLVTVKVTATTAGVIKNEACFTGDSIDHKVPQKGCDLAYVNVTIPESTPTPTPTPDQGEALSASTVQTLPVTGASTLGSTIGLGALVTASAAYLKSRKR